MAVMQEEIRVPETSFYRRIFDWKVRQWMAENQKIMACSEEHGRSVIAHRWCRQRWPFIDHRKDTAEES